MGLAFNPVGAAWVSSTEEGVSEVYDADGEALIPAVTIPGPDGDAGSPTGQVFNGDEEEFSGDSFIFVTEEGTIAGWSASDGKKAKVRVDNSGDDAVYKGVTIATPENETPLLFAADFRNAKIDVFDATYEPVTGSDFSDPDIPDGYAPFNVRAIEDSLIVTYALQDEEKEDDVKGPGKGYVNLFDLEGNLQKRLISKGELDAPWGIALAPTSFTAAPGRLLIGNFGDGLIHVYDVDLSPADEASADLEGTLLEQLGRRHRDRRALGARVRGRGRRLRGEHPLLHGRSRTTRSMVCSAAWSRRRAAEAGPPGARGGYTTGGY